MVVLQEARDDLLKNLETFIQTLEGLKESSAARKDVCVASTKLQADLQAFINRVCHLNL